MGFIGFGEIDTDPNQPRTQPPVSKFEDFIDNYLQQMQKAPTAQAGETAGLLTDKGIDESPILSESIREENNKEIPNLSIPKGTRTDTANALLDLQMKKNLNTAIVEDPENNGVLSWAGTIIGGTQRFALDPIVITSALLGGEVAKGAALVGSKFLPEASSLERFFPTIVRKLSLSGLEGGVFGFVDGLASGEIEAKKRGVEKGEEIPATTVVQNAIKESAITAGGGIALDMAARGISKGFNLLKGDFNAKPVLDEELARREELPTKQQIQERTEQIKQNHLQAATSNIKNANQNIDNVIEESQNAISKFKTANPEHTGINQLDETLKVIKNEDIPVNEKIPGLMMLKKELSDLSIGNDDILKDNIDNIEKNTNSYLNNVSVAKNSEDVNSLNSILSNYRLITPNDFSNLQKVAIAQLEDGRAADVSPYINELVLQNAKNLRDQLDETGINKGKVLHAILDSLDVIKERQKNIDETLENSRELLKETKDKGERSLLKGVINGREALKTAALHQQAVHELLATAVTDSFEKLPKEDISAYLANQTTRDADFIGGYNKLLEDLGGKGEDLPIAKEAKEPFTLQSEEDLEKIKTRKQLVAPLVKDAIKCLIGK